MRIYIFVIVTEGKGPELLGKTLSAGVIFPAAAIAVTTPVAEGPGNACQLIIVG